MTEQNKLIKCTFNKSNRKEILGQLTNRARSSKNGVLYESLINEVRSSYTNIEIDYLLKSYEIKNKHYTDESIARFVTLLMGIGAFIISILSVFISILSVIISSKNKIPDINNVLMNTKTALVWTIVIIITGCILIIVSRAFSSIGSKLNTAIFLLRQAKKLDGPQKNEQTDKVDDQ